jgi:hypothetical protein
MTGEDDRNRELDNGDQGLANDGGDPVQTRGGRGRGSAGRAAQIDEVPRPSDPPLDDDPEPRDSLRYFKINKARTETGKEIEPILEAVILQEPAQFAADRAIQAAYEAATADDDAADNLRNLYCDVEAAFGEAARYLLAKAPRQEWSLLERWIHRNLRKEGAPVRKLLITRGQVRERLRARAGPRELIHRDAQVRTSRWANAWKAWSNPTKNIRDIITSYKDRIGVLKDLANDKATADKAILEFWFEVAPLHLGLSPERVTEEDAPGLEQMLAALEDFEDVQAWLSSGRGRSDGSLYLIDADRLPGKRERVLEAWREAANDEAEAQADYELRPDDAAKLQERHTTLERDKWIGLAKEMLGPPAVA